MVYYFLLACSLLLCFFFFFFNDTATTEIYTLSLHDALPISQVETIHHGETDQQDAEQQPPDHAQRGVVQKNEIRSEEHTSELQSQSNLVCRLLLEKKKNKNNTDTPATTAPTTKTRKSRQHKR